MMSEPHPPIVDGKKLEDRYSVLFEQQEFPLDAMFHGVDGFRLGSYLRGARITAWITKRNHKGEYEKYREVTGSEVTVWDEQGRVWEYNGIDVKVIEDNIDFEKLYEEDN